jgi:hypothetical protein
MNPYASNRPNRATGSATAAAKTALSTSRIRRTGAAHRGLVLGALGLVAALGLNPAFAQKPLKQKTTGSNIVRSVDNEAADGVRLEPVEVMLGAVLDARAAAREARDTPSALPDLPVLDGSAFLDDAPAAQPPR